LYCRVWESVGVVVIVVVAIVVVVVVVVVTLYCRVWESVGVPNKSPDWNTADWKQRRTEGTICHMSTDCCSLTEAVVYIFIHQQ